MTKGEALYNFFSQFGITAYKNTSVPDDVTFPYLTYNEYQGAWEDKVSLTVDLWYYTKSEAVPNAKAAQISSAIGVGGVQIACDGGVMWITRGSPFVQSLVDETDKQIKRRYMNIDVQFLTLN